MVVWLYSAVSCYMSKAYLFLPSRSLSNILFSTQKILQHGRMAEQGLMKADPVNESISLELDMINIL